MKPSYIVLFTLSLLVISTGAAYAQTVTINQGAHDPVCANTDSCITPSNITIDIGETITWETLEGFPPFQFLGGTPETGFDGPGSIQTGFIRIGDPKSHTFNEVGVFPYYAPPYSGASTGAEPHILGEVTVIDPAIGDFTVTNLRILDDTKQPVDTVPTNETYFVAVDLRTINQSSPFRFYMEFDIQGPSGEFETTTVAMQGDSFFPITHQAIPLKPGAHVVTIRTFDNEIDLNPLAPFVTVFFDIEGPEFFTNEELAFIVKDLQAQIDALEIRVNLLERLHDGTITQGFSQRVEIITSDSTQ